MGVAAMRALALSWVLVATLGAADFARAEGPPLSVVYGPKASTAEGDVDHREVIYFSVPASEQQLLYVRVFDAETGGANDTLYGGRGDQTRYRLYGGTGALDGSETASEMPVPVPTGGVLLADRVVGNDPALDGKWLTLLAVRPDQGELADGRRFFRLAVEGVGGDGGNLFALGVSLRDARDVEPDDLQLVSYSPTVRVPSRRVATELRFLVPADADRLVLHSFDAASGSIVFTTAFRTLPLASSGQNVWRQSEIEVPAEARGTMAALVLSGGDEMPNDVTVFVADSAGRALPLLLPPTAQRLNARPVPLATIEPLASCLAVSFDASPSTDADGDKLAYAWQFGDGGAADGRVVIHEYPAPGRYIARLAVTDSSGQTGNGSIRDFDVLVKQPPRAVAGAAIVVAPGESVAFDGRQSVAGEQPIQRYSWDFRDGKGGEGAVTAHSFAAPGTYLVTLAVDDGTQASCSTAVDRRLVTVNAPPVAVAGPERRVTAGENVTFDAGRSYDVDGRIVAYEWDLGDGTLSSEAVIGHVYSAPGVYLAKLTVRDDAAVANSVAVDTARILVNAPPLAKASGPARAAIGEVITFDGSASTDSDGRVVDYVWDFGDGGRGDGVTTSYAYKRPGTYNVTLTVRDNSGTATGTASDAIQVIVNDPPVADAGDHQVVTASEVQFDGSRSHDADDRIVSYSWDFGDGTTGSGMTPLHVYKAAGSYLVRLTVQDGSATMRNTDTASMRVTVNAGPIADAGPDMIGAPGQEMTFDAGGSIDPDGDVASYQWNFDDGAAAAGRRVTHAFAEPGTYHVRLQIQDDTGQERAVDHGEARVVVNARPVAKAGPERRIAPGDEVRFDGGDSVDPDGTIKVYRWDFSDLAEPLFGEEVARRYTEPGIYKVQLTVTDESGASNASAEDSATIRVNHRPAASAGPNIVTADSTVSFDGSGSKDADGDPISYRWDFGDGASAVSGAQITHSYADGGIYPITLTVDDGTGLANATDTTSIKLTINRAPIAKASAKREVCAGDVVLFDGGGSSDPDGGLLRYRWDFGNGDMADTVNPTRIFKLSGIYPVTLTVEDEAGLANSTAVDRIAVRIDEGPIAVAGRAQTVCANAETRFDGSASRVPNGVIDRYLWNFGDGTDGSGEKPVHVFTQPGEFRVVLTIEGDQAGQCDNTNSDDTQIRVLKAPDARIEAPDRVPAGEATTYRAVGPAGTSVTWRWDFGDGITAEGEEVDHVYPAAGIYLVTVTLATEAEASECRSASARHRVAVNAPPVADPGLARTVLVDEAVDFDGRASSDPDGAITLYSWDFGDGTVEEGIAPRHRFRAPGTYPVTLTVTDDSGLAAGSTSTSVDVVVTPPLSLAVRAPDWACPGEHVAFDVDAGTLPTDMADRLQWSFGDAAGAIGASVSHAFAKPGLYAIGVAGADPARIDVRQAAGRHLLRINEPPRTVIRADKLVCPGAQVRFDGSGSTDPDGTIADLRWDFGDGNGAEGAVVNHVFQSPGLYAVRLSTTDNSGSRCATTTEDITVRVVAQPIASAQGDLNGFVGGAHDDVRLDASASRDPDHRSLTYLWDLGDGKTAAGEKVAHGYAKPGVYPVRLTADNGTGLTCGRATDTLEVTISGREP